MKHIFFHATLGTVMAIALFSCSDDTNTDDATMNDTVAPAVVTTETTETVTETYIDLNTGDPVKKDPQSGRYITESGKNVIFYIDPVKHDTFYALSGDIVNFKLKNLGKGTWQFEDKKIKIDEDDIKIEYKDGTKVKIEDEEMKIKRPDGSKTKSDQDGFKDKNDERKIKVEDGEVKVKDN